MYLTYTSRMMECRQDGYEEGISIGLERGAYQNKLETAKSIPCRRFAPRNCCSLYDSPTRCSDEVGGKPR